MAHSSERNRRIEALFDAALDLDPEERAVFLDRECAGDALLRAQIVELLAASSDDSGDFAWSPTGPYRPDEEVFGTGVRIGMKIHGHRVIRQLGQGGIGGVYLAEHETLRTPVTVKISGNIQKSDQDGWFLRFVEANRRVASLRHPGIAKLIDMGWCEDGSLYILREYLEGETLGAYLNRYGTVPEQTAVALVRQVARALAAVHGQKIVHRNLKPENIFLTSDPEMPGGLRAFLLDFELTKLVDEDDVESEGEFVGTPVYMAPEQWEALRDLDHRADLHALGIVFFELLCGQLPWMASSLAEYRLRLRLPAPSVREHNPTVSKTVADIVARLLENDREKRFQSAGELVDALERARMAMGNKPRRSALVTIERLARRKFSGMDLRHGDLPIQNLREANLEEVDLRDGNLRGADLAGANLRRAYLRGADLHGASLVKADLRGADLRGADLTDAECREASLASANLSGATLHGIDVTGANLHDAIFSKADDWRPGRRGPALLAIGGLVAGVIFLLVLALATGPALAATLSSYSVIYWVLPGLTLLWALWGFLRAWKLSAWEW